MRISDWSSDVCSSDLTDGERPREVRPQKIRGRLRQAGEGVLYGPAVAAPGIGQDQSARRPSQQMHAQLAFQPADAVADGAAGDAEAVGRRGQTPQAGHRLESLDPSQRWKSAHQLSYP